MVSTDAAQPKSPAELRKFGLVMAVPLSLIATYLWWKGNGVWTYLAGAATQESLYVLSAAAMALGAIGVAGMARRDG